MIRVAISVEGQSEDRFCKSVLIPYFMNYDIYITPIIIMTSKDKCGTKYKGGCISIDRIKNEIKKLLPSFDYVTTFYDFYGFKDRPTDDVDKLEKILYNLFDNEKFIPYIQKYEFETLLFSKPEYYEEYFENDYITSKMKQIIRDCQDDIEKINDSPQTAPSKRIEKLFDEMGETYNKILHGEGIANDIGIEVMRQKAKRFNAWIEKIISLGIKND